jgi:hypothetical protein
MSDAQQRKIVAKALAGARGIHAEMPLPGLTTIAECAGTMSRTETNEPGLVPECCTSGFPMWVV